MVDFGSLGHEDFAGDEGLLHLPAGDFLHAGSGSDVVFDGVEDVVVVDQAV